MAGVTIPSGVNGPHYKVNQVLLLLFRTHSFISAHSLSTCSRRQDYKGSHTRCIIFEEKPKGYYGWSDWPPWTHSSDRPAVIMTRRPEPGFLSLVRASETMGQMEWGNASLFVLLMPCLSLSNNK